MSLRVGFKKLVSLAALGTALAATSATARDRGLADAESRLSDPKAQQAMGDALATMMAAMMQIKAAPLLKAMDSMGTTMGERRAARGVPADATLGDLAGPEARDMPREMAHKVPQMMGAMGAMAGAMGEMLPQLETMGKRMERQMDRAMDKVDRQSKRHAADNSAN